MFCRTLYGMCAGTRQLIMRYLYTLISNDFDQLKARLANRCIHYLFIGTRLVSPPQNAAKGHILFAAKIIRGQDNLGLV